MPNLIVYYLKSCSTCNRIIKELKLPACTQFRCIKEQEITMDELEKMKQFSGSYESLFSKRAIKYKSLGLKEKKMQEKDLKKLILDEYTFLKRPVFLFENEIYIGNSKKIVALMQKKLE